VKIEVLRLAIDFGLMVLIWMVQLLIYPGFKYFDATHFKDWHREYARNMGFIVAPVMFAQVGMCIYFFYNFSGQFTTNIIYAVLIALTWITTFTIFVPIHNKMDRNGMDIALCDTLTRRNWIRVILWTAIVLLDLQMLYGIL
jgi:hypothetical protein